MADDTPRSQVSKEEFEQSLIYRKQCVLIILGDALAFLNKSTGHIYENFTVLEGDASTMASKLVARKGVDKLFQLRASELSNLVPRIRLFKSFEKNVGDPNSEVVDVEFRFSDHVFEEIINPLAGNDGYTGNVGLKHFSYVYDGGNIATKYFSKCKMSLYFRSLEDLTAPQNNDGEGPSISFLDLIKTEAKFDDTGLKTLNPDYYTVKAVLGWAVPRNSTLPQDLRDVIDSYSTVLTLTLKKHHFNFNENGSIELDIDFFGTVDSAFLSPQTNILASSESIRIQNEVYRHKARLQKREREIEESKTRLKKAGLDLDSTVTIDNFEGNVAFGFFLENQNRTLENAFFTDYENTRASNPRSPYDALSGHFKRDFRFDKEYTSERFRDDFNNVFHRKAEANAIKNGVLVNLERELTGAQTETYNRLLNRIIAKDRVFYFDVDRKFLGAFKKFETISNFLNIEEYELTQDGIERQEWLEERDRIFNEGINSGKIVNSVRSITNDQVIKSFQDEIGILVEAQDNVEQDGEKKFIDELASKRNFVGQFASRSQNKDKILEWRKEQLEASTDTKVTTDALGAGKERIEFLYLGDILDAALQNMKQENQFGNLLKKSEILLGSVQLYRGDNIYEISIADMPISLELFTNWFLENVVRKQLKSYLFRDFLKDCMNTLIPAAAKALCYGKDILGLAEIRTTNFTLPGSKKKSMFDRYKNRRINMDLPHFEQHLQNAKLTGFALSQDYYNYILINCTRLAATERMGNPEEDFNQGIYHLYVGNEKGLVKSIGFDKEDNADIQASNLLNNRDNPGAEIIRDFYDARIDMVGNSLFYPGQLIFINPTLAGLGSPARRATLARLLGIGGYYDVLRVEGELDDTGFRTTVNAKWKGFPNVSGKALRSLKIVGKAFLKPFAGSDE